MKFIGTVAAFILAFSLLPSQAEARHHYRHHRIITDRIQPTVATGCSFDNNGHQACLGSVQRTSSLPNRSEGVVGGRPAGCPHAYCGCSASLRVFGRIIPELNLAANWRRFPSAMAAAGMAAWRYGHVFIIESVNGDGTVVAHDGNSGHGLTRVHTVSLRGYRVVNPNGSHLAMR